MKQAVIIDYGMGNLHSAAKATVKAASGLTGEQAYNVTITRDAKTILAADRVIFPGVGAMRDCMSELQRLELDDVIRQVATNKPMLAICVGMQALMHHSDENGGVGCLNIIPGEVKRFSSYAGLKVPHMGWNVVDTVQVRHPLWRRIPTGERFYFVHSYYVQPEEESIVAATTDYGFRFTSVIARDNLFAVQFHPEKSSSLGLQLLENFLTWTV